MGVPTPHFPHELRFGLADVRERLPGLGMAREDDKVDRVSSAQRAADLALVLEAADARSVAGARVDDDVGTASFPLQRALWRNDAHQGVVDRPRELGAVDDRLVVEGEDGPGAHFLVFEKNVPTLAQTVEEQDLTLTEVDQIVLQVLHRRCGSNSPPSSSNARWFFAIASRSDSHPFRRGCSPGCAGRRGSVPALPLAWPARQATRTRA